MTSRKARRFRAIFTRNFLKNILFSRNIDIFRNYHVIKRNLKWIFISYGIYETRCVFYIPSLKARGYKTHNSFHKYRMKWKFISDPIYICLYKGAVQQVLYKYSMLTMPHIFWTMLCLVSIQLLSGWSNAYIKYYNSYLTFDSLKKWNYCVFSIGYNVNIYMV